MTHNSRYLLILSTFVVFVALGCKNEGNKSDNTSEDDITSLRISDSLPWSERMAQSIMKRHPEAWQAENDSIGEWDYKTGLSRWLV